MQTTPLKPPKLSKDGGGPLSTKNGSIAAALVAAAVAGLLIIFFLQQYRSSVNNEGVPTPVVVAQQVIEQGASADTAGTEGRYKTTNVPRDQLKRGAITDAGTLRGKVAVTQIVPGQQLTTKDFKVAGHGLVTKLAADQRAIAVALDSAHGLIGNLHIGDHVDLLSGFELQNSNAGKRAVMRMLLQDVLVLDVPKKASGGIGANANATGEITLRVATGAAQKVAYAADNGVLYLVLRPQDGAKLESSSLTTQESLLAGARAAQVPGR